MVSYQAKDCVNVEGRKGGHATVIEVPFRIKNGTMSEMIRQGRSMAPRGLETCEMEKCLDRSIDSSNLE